MSMFRKAFAPITVAFASVLLSSGPAAFATTFERLVPAAAHAAGAHDTFFQTDLVLGNLATRATTATITFLPRGEDNGALSRQATIPVPAGASVRLVDVVGTTFHLDSAAGAILVRADLPLSVRSRTYNLARINETDATWGQSLSGVDPEEAFGPGRTAHLLGLRGTGGYRSNLGLASFSSEPQTVTISIFDVSGQLLATRDVALLPYMAYQMNDIFTALAITAPAEPVRAEITSVGTGVLVVPYASVVDDRTGDPTTIAAESTDDASTTLFFPSSAHAAGVAGAFFVTDTVIWNPSNAGASVQISFRPFGSGTVTASQRLSFSGGLMKAIDDIVGEGLLGLDAAAGSITIESNVALLAASRIYNRAALAADGGVGTAGQDMPPAEAVLEGCGFARVDDVRKSPLIRTNVGLANPGDSQEAITLALWSFDGGLLGTRQLSLAARESRQINDVAGTLFGLESLPGGYLTTSLDAACAASRATSLGGALALYASSIDNTSGDPTTLLPTLVGPLTTACTASPSSGAAPLEVSFAATIEGSWGDPVSTSWNFGDGSATAAGTSATHTYSTPGSYTATFSTTDPAGRTATCSRTVAVYSPFVVQCDANPKRGKTPVTVSFTGANVGGAEPIKFSWDYGDGTAPSTGSWVVHVYTTAGIFNAVLTATDAHGVVETCSVSITVLDCPVPEVQTFEISPKQICPGQTSTLTWKVNNADTISISPSIGTVGPQGTLFVSPAATTNYVITGTSGCGTDTAQVTLTVTQPPAISNISMTPNPVTFGQTAALKLTITNGGSCTLTSSIGNHIAPSSLVGNGTFNLSYKADTATGTDTITIVDTNSCGQTTTTFTATVN